MTVAPPLKTIIVDDEELARQMIREYLYSYPGVEIIAECSAGNEAVATINSLKPDLIFLDIQMPEHTGFEILPRLECVPHIIFSTAFDKYALKAFEVNAVDYLLKPYDKARFDQAIKKVLQRIQSPAQPPDEILSLLNALQRDHHQNDRFWIKDGGLLRPVRHDTIDWVEAMDDYVCLHVGSEQFLVSQTMKELETRLSAKCFMRIHRSTIVNLDRIKELRSMGDSSYQVVLKDGTKLALSRAQAKQLRRQTL